MGMKISATGFLATLASAAAVFASACAHPNHKPEVPVPPTAQSQPADNSSKPPLVTENPDGTVTIQKPPAEGKKDGLVIKPQVITPPVKSSEEAPKEEPAPPGQN